MTTKFDLTKSALLSEIVTDSKKLETDFAKQEAMMASEFRTAETPDADKEYAAKMLEIIKRDGIRNACNPWDLAGQVGAPVELAQQLLSDLRTAYVEGQKLTEAGEVKK